MHAITAKIILQPDNINKASTPSNLVILGLQAIERLGITTKVERASKRRLWLSFSKAISINKPILLDNNSISTLYALNKSANT